MANDASRSVYDIVFEGVEQGIIRGIVRTAVVHGFKWLWNSGDVPKPAEAKQPSDHDKKLAIGYMLAAIATAAEPEVRHGFEFEGTFHLHRAAEQLAKAHKLDPTCSVMVDQGTDTERRVTIDSVAADLCFQEATFYYNFGRNERLKLATADPAFHMNPKQYQRERDALCLHRFSRAKFAIDRATTLAPDNLGYIQQALRIWKEYAIFAKTGKQFDKDFDALVGRAFAIDRYHPETLRIVG